MWVANTDGSQPTQVTHAYMGMTSVQWDDRGRTILADCTPYGQHDVCLVDLETGAIDDITEEITFDTGVPYPHWFEGNIAAGTQVLDTHGTIVDILPYDGRISPDGTKIAAIVDGQLAVSNIDGSNLQQLTSDDAAKGFPAWGPSSDLIIYTAAPGDGSLYLYIIRADGTNPYMLVQQPIAAGPASLPATITTYLGYNWAP